MKKTATEFGEHQFDAIYPEGVQNHYWTCARNKIIANTLKRRGCLSGRILEVGCGKGIVVEYLRKRGFAVKGVDIANIVPRSAVREHVRTGIDAASLPHEERITYDTLLLLDVLEHLPTPENFLKQLCQDFPNVKCIVATVPARMELFSNWDELNGHYRRYDRNSVKKLVMDAGGCPRKITYFFHSLWLPARLSLLLKGGRAAKINPPHRRIAISLHHMLGLFFYAEYFLFPDLLPGTSLIFDICFPTSEKQL